jgi:uncharacterized membrane protein
MPEVVKTHTPDFTDKAFKIGLYLKGHNGLLEILGGIFLLLIKPDQINRFAHWLTQGELSQDPHDFVANHILKTAHHLAGASLIFGAIYLLSHGIVKLVLVIEVLRDHLWAYLALVIVIGLFIVYQTYSSSSSSSSSGWGGDVYPKTPRSPGSFVSVAPEIPSS